MKNPESSLATLLRVFGIVDLLAVAAVVTPVRLHGWAHEAMGLGKLPVQPLVEYLTRSSSSLYAMHGAILLFLASDIRRYRRLIRFLAWIRIAHGIVLVGVDLSSGMPGWWMLGEGGLYFLPSLAMLWMVEQIRPEKPLQLS